MSNMIRFESRGEPFSDLFDDLLRGYLVRPVFNDGAARMTAGPVRMKVDIAENNGTYVLSAELPGVKKDDIQVTIDGAQVTLSAEVKREKDAAEGDRALHAERVYGRLARSFTLPQELDEAAAQAKFADGVLELTLPRKAAAARRQVTIQ